MTPTTKVPVQIELATLLSSPAVPSLDIPKPVACNVDASSDHTDSNTGRHKDKPHITGIEQPTDMP